MRKLHAPFVASLLAFSCNEALGLHAGVLGNHAGGGADTSAGSNGESGSAPAPSGSGGNAATGGKGPPGGGAAGVNPVGGGRDSGRGGNSAGVGSGSSSGEGGAGDGGADVGGAGVGGGDNACSWTADCIEQGLAAPPHLCLGGACINILGEACDTVMGAEWVKDHPEDQAVVFGALAPYFGEHYFAYPSLELAMQEFTAHGPIPIDGVERRPVLLVCRPYTYGDDALIRRSLDHLIDHVGVSGMLVLASRADVLTSLQYAVGAKHADIFLLDSGGGNGALLGSSDGGNLWHMRSDVTGLSIPYPRVVERVEEHVNPGATTGQSSRKTRLVLVPPQYDDDFESAIIPALEYTIFINGNSLLSNPNDYRMVATQNRDADIIAAEVATFEPDIVLDFAGIAWEIDLAVRNRELPLPFYVLPPSQARWGALYESVASYPSLRTRIVGLADPGPDPGDTALLDAYLERYDAIAREDYDGWFGAGVYDAVYFMVYAAVSGGTGGTAMTDGMRRLIAPFGNLGSRPRGDIGPETIDSVVDLLRAGESLNLFGTLGPPSFDPSTGGRTRYSTVWCINGDLEFVMDVLRFAPGQSGGLVGTFPCFPF